MGNPYAVKGPNQFWRTAVGDVEPANLWPVPVNRFEIDHSDAISTAGSCFAQNVSKYLMNMEGANFLHTEVTPPDQPVFSARYGNIYTTAQLLQLIREATGKLHVPSVAVRRPDDRWVDAFRPTTYKEGFVNPGEVAEERRRHLAAVQQMFARCSVFVFTLGLIEGWTTDDGLFVFPVHPGICSEDPLATKVRFRRYSYEEVKADLEEFFRELRAINPRARVILTVSPVPLTATFTDEHVLQATVYSKSLLRTVCTAIEEINSNAFYFPSYEIISGSYNNGRYYESNKRSVTMSGVEHVMRVFTATYFNTHPTSRQRTKPRQAGEILSSPDSGSITCDEEEYGTNVGF
jgi:GSCFA family